MPQNADMLPILGDATFLQVKTYPAAGMGIPLWPPGSGIQPERMFADRAEAFDDVFARWVEADADPLLTPEGHRGRDARGAAARGPRHVLAQRRWTRGWTCP